MNITIIGGGSIGTLMSAEFSLEGAHNITLYASEPECRENIVSVYNSCENLLFKGRVNLITYDLKLAVSRSDVIFITYPASMLRELAEKMFPFVRSGQKIGFVPGSGGAEFYFRNYIKKGCILFGLQRVHSIARIKERGKSVYALGRKDRLFACTIPDSQGKQTAEMLESLFKIPCCDLGAYLNLTLTPSNPILHTSRLYSLFSDYSKDRYYPENFLFYESWSDKASEIMLECDSELQKLCRTINEIDLRGVRSLKEHYESNTAAEMTNKIRSITAFKGLPSPMKQCSCGWYPDFESRYFTSDFPFGLKIIIDIAKLFDVDTHCMNKIWNWYMEISGNKNFFVLPVATQNEFLSIYL